MILSFGRFGVFVGPQFADAVDMRAVVKWAGEFEKFERFDDPRCDCRLSEPVEMLAAIAPLLNEPLRS